jgi:hypothetical protein
MVSKVSGEMSLKAFIDMIVSCVLLPVGEKQVTAQFGAQECAINDWTMKRLIYYGCAHVIAFLDIISSICASLNYSKCFP